MNDMRDLFSDEHHQYRDTVRRFFRTEVDPHARAWEAQGIFPREIFRKAAAAGLLQPSMPTEYGGGGGDLLHEVIVSEEHGHCLGVAGLEAFLSTDLSSHVIWRTGTEAQKRYWIPKYASGDVVAEVGITEPQSGSDAASTRTTAVRQGDHFVLNGTKAWISNLTHCDMVLVLARTNPAEQGAKGLSILLVDTASPGFTRSKPMETAVKGAGNVGTAYFDDVKVPIDRLLGGVEGKGLAQVMTAVNTARLVQASRWLACCESAFALTVDYVKERKAFGQRVLDFQNTQFRLADVKTDIAVGRGFLDNLLRRALKGDVSFEDSAMAKLWISEMETRVMDQCVQLHGGAGVANESPISKLWTSSRVHRIFIGTSEMQRMAIARSIGT
ncbi:MAG: acyl-CoA dehydrogenase family protein [Steroidobacteraceae bacterium]